MSLSEVCKAIKNRIENDYVTYIDKVTGHKYYGMCSILNDLMVDEVITPYEGTLFINEWESYASSTDNPFYWNSGRPTQTRGAFGWPLREKEARIAWLNERILQVQD
jgi:hypothetical protein